jgi:putative peptide zinc metalloprotease protein
MTGAQAEQLPPPSPTSAVAAAAEVRLHELVFRPDPEGWIVGRPATGEFVVLPQEAKTLLDLFGAGATIAEAKARADAAHGTDLDVAGFVEDLVELGFAVTDALVAADGQAVRPQSLPWLRPRSVRWVFTRPVAALLTAFVLAALTLAVRHHELPTYHAFFALREPGLNALVAAVLVMLVVAVHEFWHLAAARAANVEGWIGWSTRLIFLVAQTRVPGLWSVERRVRIRVFLAGMASDLVIGSACLLCAALTAPESLAHRLSEQLSLSIFLGFAAQFAVFLRTDVYLVVQELSGCKNLYSDALARLRWLTTRTVRRGGAAPDPTLALPHNERRPVRIYAVVVALGVLAALVTFACYQAPVMVETIVLAVRELGHGLRSGSAAQCTDALLVLVITVFFEGLLAYKLARKHGARLRRAVSVKAGDQSVHADQTSARSAG